MPFRRRRRAVQEPEKVAEQAPKQEEQLEPAQPELLTVSPALLRHPRLDLPANVAPRAALLRAQQHAVGNRVLQRVLERPAAARAYLQSCPLRLNSVALCPFGGVCHTCPATGALDSRKEEEEEAAGLLAGTVPAALEAAPEEEEIQDEFGGTARGRAMGQPVPFGPGSRAWGTWARQGLARGLPEVLALQEPGTARGQAGGRVKYGETSWEPKNATFPKVEISWTPGENNQVTGKVKATTSAMGAVSMWSLPAGEYAVPGSSVTANFPQCGKGGKKVPFSTMISAEMAGIARQAEEEHRSDYTRTYTLTLKKEADIVDAVAAQSFGPDSKEKVQQQIDAALQAGGHKTRDQWVSEINRMNALSLQRDRPPGASAHTLKSDGEPVSCPEDCSKVVATTVRAPSTNVPGVSSESLIN